MLTRIPGSVFLYSAVPRVPLGVAEPPPETFKLIHWG